MYFVTKARLKDRECWEFVNVQVVAFASQWPTVHSTNLQWHRSHKHCSCYKALQPRNLAITVIVRQLLSQHSFNVPTLLAGR